MYEPKKVLITGAAGLLGSRLAEWILENQPDVEVLGLDDFSVGCDSNVRNWLLKSGPYQRAHFNQDNLYDLDTLKKLFERYRPDVVYHFAAYAAEGLSPFIRSYNYINNTVATANVVTSCIGMGVKRLVFTSSMAVYGNQQTPFHEESVPAPVDPYGIAKFACEMDIAVAGEQHGLDWCILRPHNVYGRGQIVSDPYRNVLGIWMYENMHGEPLTIYGDGEQTRAFSCVDDSLEPMWKAGFWDQASRQIINLGGIRHYTIKEAVETIIDVMGTGEAQHVEARHEVKHAHSTWEKSVELLEFEHKTDLREGLTDMWKWVQSLEEVPRRLVWDRYELDKGLYDFWRRDKLGGKSPHKIVSRRPVIAFGKPTSGGSP